MSAGGSEFRDVEESEVSPMRCGCPRAKHEDGCETNDEDGRSFAGRLSTPSELRKFSVLP